MDVLFWYVFFSIFIVGLITGSFLNCVIWRANAGESALSGRSYCPRCKHKLAWRDLFPLFSFLALAGKCRYCKKPISVQYPLVEMATGIFFVAAAWTFAPGIFSGRLALFAASQLLAYWTIAACLIVIFVTDLKWYFIPDGAVVFGVAAAMVLRGLQFIENRLVFGTADIGALAGPLLAAVFAASFFAAIFLVSRGAWMGFGDVKYVFLMGLALGLPAILVGLFLAFLFGAILGLGLVAAKKKKMSAQIPFGPFLVVGTIVALFFSDPIISWYLSIGTY